MKGTKSKEMLLMFGAFSASALMLTVMQVPFEGGFFAWVCLVPFILVCRPEARLWRLMWISYVVSFLYWLGNLYWIGLVTVPAYVLFSMSQGLYWPVLVVCVRYVRRKWPGGLLVAVPILFVGAEAWQGVIYTGFNWRLLGHSQWNNLPVIQIADVFGAAGVSLLIAVVNGLVAELIIAATGGKILRVQNAVKVCIAGCLIAGTLIYGHRRLAQTPEHITAGPVVGSVQPNIPSEIKEMSESGDAILDDLISDSNDCFDAGAELVAWPETIVLSTLNQDFLSVLVSLGREDDKAVVYNRAIERHTKDKGYVLLGSHARTLVESDDGTRYLVKDQYNSAFLYTPAGLQDPERYDKMHLVPFGEYIPFKESVPFIYQLVLNLSPYDYDYNLTKGAEFTTFEMKADNKKYGFGALICYDDTDPKVTRRMVVSDEGKKKADWLVNISNDGWYVRYKNGKVLPSVELSQRTAITAFRAVENRVSIIRSVNTGISCLIDSTGLIRDGFISGTLPEAAMDRQGVEGWFVDRIAIDDRVTFFSRHGQWLEFLCGAVITAAVLAACIDAARGRRSGKAGR